MHADVTGTATATDCSMVVGQREPENLAPASCNALRASSQDQPGGGACTSTERAHAQHVQARRGAFSGSSRSRIPRQRAYRGVRHARDRARSSPPRTPDGDTGATRADQAARVTSLGVRHAGVRGAVLRLRVRRHASRRDRRRSRRPRSASHFTHRSARRRSRRSSWPPRTPDRRGWRRSRRPGSPRARA